MEELVETVIEFKTHKDENGMLCLDNYKEIKKILELSKTACDNLAVENEITYKQAKKYRATINKTSKQITSLKTSFLKDYVFDYDTKSKELNNLLKETGSVVDEKVKEYEKKIGIAKQEIITVTFKTHDPSVADKLLDYGLTIGIQGEKK